MSSIGVNHRYMVRNMQVPAAAAWTPASITGLVGWYDASVSGSITQSGGAVSQWNDLSGLGNHLVQATGAQQPTTGTRTLNSLNVIDFDGSADNMTCATISNKPTNRTLFIVALKDANVGNGGVLIASDTLTNGSLSYDTNAGKFRWVSIDTAVIGSPSTNGPTLGSAFQIVADRNSAVSGVYDHFMSGSTNGSGTDSTVWSGTAGGVRVGRHNNVQDWWDGYFAEIVIVDAIASAGDRTSWNSYVARWGL